MSAFFVTLLIVGILTVLGAATLILITLKYYWGERGTPPLSREDRRLVREKEIRLRARQIEHSKNNPIVTRRASFWDNSKVYR